MNVKVTQETDASGSVIIPDPKVISKVSKWQGLKISIIGDSITDPNTGGYYVDKLEQLTHATIQNLGISGTHLAGVGPYMSQGGFYGRLSSIDTDAKLILVFGGVNDFYHGSIGEVGTFEEGDSGSGTFHANLHKFFKGLSAKSKEMGVPAVFMTPLHTTYAVSVGGDGALNIKQVGGLTYDEFIAIYKRIAEFYSIIIVDAYHHSTLTPYSSPSDFSDGLHPTESAGHRLGKWLYPQLEMVYDMWY